MLKELQQRGEQIRALVLPVENADKLVEQGVEYETITGSSDQATAHLMQLSDRRPTMHRSQQTSYENHHNVPSNDDLNKKEGCRPYGMQQTEPPSAVTPNGREPCGQNPLHPARALVLPLEKQQVVWKTVLNVPAVKLIVGLLIGVGLLFLISHFVDIPTTIRLLRQNLATPRAIILGLLSGVAFLLAFSIRGVRWKLFLNPVGKVSTFKVVKLYLVGIFLNFLLPIRVGEVAKPLMLKRIARIPISHSLPTVALDKALDLTPALFIMAIVPFLGMRMDTKLWLVLGSVGGLFISLIFFVTLAAWKRTSAIGLLHKVSGVFPKSIGSRIEGFAVGFIDAMLLGIRRPKIFIAAVLLTCVAVIFEGIFAMLAFWVIGFPVPLGTAIFGYAVYNMFYILPNPPAQIGSNEAVGLLVFAGLLHLSKDKVAAMFVFSHLWLALLMCVTGMACLSSFGLTISSVMKVQTEGEGALLEAPPLFEEYGVIP